MKAPIHDHENMFCSIKKKNFGKKNAFARLLFVMLFCLLALFGLLSSWKSGIAAMGILCVACLSQAVLKVRLIILITLTVFLIGVSSYLLKTEWMTTTVITLFFSPVIFLKSIFSEIRETSVFEVFFLDRKQLKCLSKNEFSYKEYALYPERFSRAYPLSRILSFTFDSKMLLIVTKKREVIRPLELSDEDTKQVLHFVQCYFPHLLNVEGALDEGIKLTQKFNGRLLLIMIPVIIFSVIIYFFGDNGRDVTVTYSCFLLMIITSALIYKYLKYKTDAKT